MTSVIFIISDAVLILYIFIQCTVTIDAGEKQSLKILLVTINVLGAAEYSFQTDTKPDLKRVKKLVMLKKQLIIN